MLGPTHLYLPLIFFEIFFVQLRRLDIRRTEQAISFFLSF